MKKGLFVLAAAVMMSALAGCSSASASASASSKTAVDHTYSEKVDVSTLSFEETTFHDMTVSMPKEWSGRKSASADEIDYSIKGSKDSVQFIYVEGATASEEMFKTVPTSMSWTPSKTEAVELNGISAFHAKGISTVFNVIQEDANTEMYLLQDGTGVVVIVTIQDPEGDVDMTPAFEKILSTVKMK